MPIAPAGWQHIKVTTCLLSFAILTTLLRIPSRRRVRLPIGADDWSLWIALGLVAAMYIEGLICELCDRSCILADKHLIAGIPGVVYGGIGKHIVELSSKELEFLFKVCSDRR